MSSPASTRAPPPPALTISTPDEYEYDTHTHVQSPSPAHSPATRGPPPPLPPRPASPSTPLTSGMQRHVHMQMMHSPAPHAAGPMYDYGSVAMMQARPTSPIGIGAHDTYPQVYPQGYPSPGPMHPHMQWQYGSPYQSPSVMQGSFMVPMASPLPSPGPGPNPMMVPSPITPTTPAPAPAPSPADVAAAATATASSPAPLPAHPAQTQDSSTSASVATKDTAAPPQHPSQAQSPAGGFWANFKQTFTLLLNTQLVDDEPTGGVVAVPAIKSAATTGMGATPAMKMADNAKGATTSGGLSRAPSVVSVAPPYSKEDEARYNVPSESPFSIV